MTDKELIKIDLAVRLEKLGVVKRLEVGDWAFNGYLFLVDDKTIHLKKTHKCLAIPPLDWCLEWLKKEESILRINAVTSGWVCILGFDEDAADTWAINLHTAVLKAMLEVAKEGK